MTVVSQEIQDNLALARSILSKRDLSVVVIKNQEILIEKKGDGIKPILEIIDEMYEELNGSVIGDRVLGKASAFLCRYVKAGAVYSPQGTKTAIAILILGAIPCQVDELVPFIKNRAGDGLCPFEDLLKYVEKPDIAYKLLKDKTK